MHSTQWGTYLFKSGVRGCGKHHSGYLLLVPGDTGNTVAPEAEIKINLLTEQAPQTSRKLYEKPSFIGFTNTTIIHWKWCNTYHCPSRCLDVGSSGFNSVALYTKYGTRMNGVCQLRETTHILGENNILWLQLTLFFKAGELGFAFT